MTGAATTGRGVSAACDSALGSGSTNLGGGAGLALGLLDGDATAVDVLEAGAAIAHLTVKLGAGAVGILALLPRGFEIQALFRGADIRVGDILALLPRASRFTRVGDSSA